MLTRRGFAGPIIAERVHFGPDRHKLLKIVWKEKTKIRPDWPTSQFFLCKLLILWLSAGIRKKWHSTRLSRFSEKRRIQCWSQPCASLSIEDSACSYSRGRG